MYLYGHQTEWVGLEEWKPLFVRIGATQQAIGNTYWVHNSDGASMGWMGVERALKDFRTRFVLQ